MIYKLSIATETSKNVFLFEKKRIVKSFDELIEYVNEMAKIYKKSAKVVIDVYNECDKKVANFHYDYGWIVY